MNALVLAAIAALVVAIVGIALWRLRQRSSAKPPSPPPSPASESPPPAAEFPTTYPQPPVPKAPLSYERLEGLLAGGQFERADRETERVMLRAVGAEQRGYFELDDLEAFPAAVLQQVDKLWQQASDGRFGFSVQKAIYRDCDGEYSKLASRVGWVEGGQWFANRSPDGDGFPDGYFPLVMWQIVLNSFGFMGLGICFEVLFDRADLPAIPPGSLSSEGDR